MSEGRLATVKGVEVFQTGTHRGMEYTEGDLRDMVRNYYQFRDRVQPPAVVGHEEQQSLMENTGIPAMGRFINPRLKPSPEGLTLLADMVNVPASIAKLIDNRAYSKVSAEVYDEPPDGCKGGHGKMLRRVALLGGELPQIKTLADLPYADYSEYTPSLKYATLKVVEKKQSSPGVFRVFYEVCAMTKKRQKAKQFSERCKAVWKKFADEPAPADQTAPQPPPQGVTREDMIAMLQELGMDVSLITDGVPDEALAEFVRCMKARMEEAKTTQNNSDDPPKEDEKKMADCDNDNDKKMADMPIPDDKDKKMADVPTGASGTQPSQISIKFSDKGIPTNLAEVIKSQVEAGINAALKPLKDKTDATEAQVAKFHETQKKNAIDEQLTDLVKQGKVLPAEIDGGMRDHLYGLDAVKKFSDGKTQLDKAIDMLKGRPMLVKLSEAMKAATKSGTQQHADIEIQKVQRFAEEDENFGRALKAKGSSPADYVQTFSEAKKKKPSLTAAEFGVPPQYAQ